MPLQEIFPGVTVFVDKIVPPPPKPPTLLEWIPSNMPKQNMAWRDSFWSQIRFVREDLASLFCERTDHVYEEFRDFVSVISTHRSKSIVLPVYQLTWKRGCTLVLRNNFYDWAVSVKSDRDILWAFNGLCDPNKLNTYHEGFPPDWIFPPYLTSNSRAFTCSVTTNYELYAFCWALTKFFPSGR